MDLLWQLSTLSYSASLLIIELLSDDGQLMAFLPVFTSIKTLSTGLRQREIEVGSSGLEKFIELSRFSDFEEWNPTNLDFSVLYERFSVTRVG